MRNPIDATQRLNELLQQQNRLMARRNVLFAAPNARINEVVKLEKSLERVNTALQRQSRIVQYGAKTALAASFQDIGRAAVAASVGVGLLLTKSAELANPAAATVFNYRLRDLGAVIGHITAPAFLYLSDKVKQFSDYLYNLSPATKEWINSALKLLVPLTAIGMTLGGILKIVMPLIAGFRALRGMWTSMAAMKMAGGAMDAAGGAAGAVGAAGGAGRGGLRGLGMTAAKFAGTAGLGALALGGGANEAKVFAAEAAALMPAGVSKAIGKGMGKVIGQTAGKMVGRAIPFVGWGLLADDALGWATGGYNIQAGLAKLTGFGSGNNNMKVPDLGNWKDSAGLAPQPTQTLTSGLQAGRMFREASLGMTGPSQEQQVQATIKLTQQLEKLNEKMPEDNGGFFGWWFGGPDTSNLTKQIRERDAARGIGG